MTINRYEQPQAQTSQPTLGDDIRLVISVMWGGRRIILAATLLAMMAAAAYAFLLTDTLYSATTELLFDPRQSPVASGSSQESTVSNSTPEAHTTLIESQAQIISSEELARQFILDQELIYDPEFVGNGSGSEQARYDAALETYYKRLSVERAASTYVIAISFESVDPAKAAHLANRLAELYLETASGTDASMTTQAADALSARLTDLRQAANDAAAAVEQYKRDNGLITTEELTVVGQQLRDLNSQLSLAHVERSDAEANLTQAQRAADSGVLTFDASSTESSVIGQLQVQLAALEGQEARLRAQYLPQHPALAGVLEEKAALTAALNAEFQRMLQNLQRVYDAAVEKESSLVAQVEALQNRSADSGAASVQLGELQREATAAQTVYENFLNRATQLREQVGLPTDTARVISSAYPPSKPSSPRRLIFVAAGGVLGAGLGIVWVWMAFIITGGISQRVASARPSPRREAMPVEPAYALPVRPVDPYNTSAYAQPPMPQNYRAPAAPLRTFARASEAPDLVPFATRTRSFARPSELGEVQPARPRRTRYAGSRNPGYRFAGGMR